MLHFACVLLVGLFHLYVDLGIFDIQLTWWLITLLIKVLRPLRSVAGVMIGLR